MGGGVVVERKFSQCQMEEQLAPLSLLRGWIFLYRRGVRARGQHIARARGAASCHSLPPARHLVIKGPCPRIFNGGRAGETGGLRCHMAPPLVRPAAPSASDCSLIINPPESAFYLLLPHWIFFFLSPLLSAPADECICVTPSPVETARQR